jgi:arylsulfatase A-like enzyme
MPAFAHSVRNALPVGLGLLALACAGAGRDPSVVLITLDTVRADHLGCYGYSRTTSPRIDAFAKGATLYRRSLATAPWTLPTHASLFTGRHPFEHGAHSFRVTAPGNNINPLAASQLTLAEALRGEGFQTGAIVANAGYLARRYGVDQGFETYLVGRSPARIKNRQAFKWLAEKQAGPFLLFVNYMDAHRPYNTAPRPGLLPRPAAEDASLVVQLYEAVMPGTAPPPRGLAEQVKDQYDTAIANLDEEVGRLLDRLQAIGAYDDAVVVITSDHGEYFGEHALVEHSKDVYQEVLFVPLIVKAPRQARGRVEERVVSSVDVPRLILEGFTAARRERLVPLFPYVPGNHPVVAEAYFTRSKDLFDPRWGFRFARVRTALFEWPIKLIASSDGRHELYDLAADPREAASLFATRGDVAGRLTGRLQAFLASRPRASGPDDARPQSDEDLEELRALGYVGEGR